MLSKTTNCIYGDENDRAIHAFVLMSKKRRVARQGG